MRTLNPLLACIACTMLAGLQSFGANPPASAPATQPQTPEIDRLTLHPSATTRPALQHRLLPDWTDRTPGNAVTLYLMARQFWPDQKTTDEILSPENGRYDYLDTPIDQFPRKYADRLMAEYAMTLAYVDLGARRKQAVWDTGWDEPSLRGRPSTSYLSDLRHAANLLGFRVRYQLLKGDWAGAEYTLQTEFSMARQIMAKPLAIHALVSSGFTSLALSRGVESWVSRGASPNLYWPLTELPQPFVDYQSVLQEEQLELHNFNPELFKAVYGDPPPEQWPRIVSEMIAMPQESVWPFKRDPAKIEQETRRLTGVSYPRAKRYLLAAGIAQDKVEAMSVDQAVGTYWSREYRNAYDDLAKFWQLPYRQAEQQMSQAWRALAPDKSPALDNPLIQANLVAVPNPKPNYAIPNLLRYRYQFAQVDRQIALLRTIEALRDYAARHDGTLPDRLDQITDLPVPVDTFTDKPFGYSRNGQIVTLDAPAPPGHPPIVGWRMELTFVRGS